MRLSSILALALLVFSIPGYADTVVVGSDLSSTAGGSALCPDSSRCDEDAQQFTLLVPVTIDEVKLTLSGPALSLAGPGGGASFNAFLGNVLGTGAEIGSGVLVFGTLENSFTTEIFDFTGLNLSLDAGTYFLQLTGGDIEWTFGQASVTSAGTIGPTWTCDPSEFGCETPTFWQSAGTTHALEIDGTVATPEPTSFALFGTGILGLVGVAKRRFCIPL
jgi:hypothetical protein